MKDIATKANVSLTTASMVLNNKESAVRISEKTKLHVLEVAASLGYIPNLSARQLRQAGNQELTLALLLPVDSRVLMMGELLNGIQQFLQSEQCPMPCSLMVETYRPGKIADVKGLYSPHRFNGAIVANLSQEDQHFLHEQPSKVPCVLLQRSSSWYSCVDADNYYAGQKMARHFIAGGHRQLIVLTPFLHSDAIQRRLNGIRDEIAANRERTVELIIRECEFSEAGGYDAVELFLAEGVRPGGLICLSDTIAIGAISALNEQHIHVPDMCEVMGCDNSAVAKYMIPRLTTVVIPIHQMIYEAAKLLVHQIMHPAAEREHKTFGVSIVYRQTTKPPAEAGSKENLGGVSVEKVP